jgi:hypothetical protein
MALSKKHFELIAECIKHQVTHTARRVGYTEDQRAAAHGSLNELASVLCGDFEIENPRFDRQRFLKACGF